MKMDQGLKGEVRASEAKKEAKKGTGEEPTGTVVINMTTSVTVVVASSFL